MRIEKSARLMVVLALAAGPVVAASDDLPAWNQPRAVELVERVLECEQAEVLPWDQIDWMTDAAEAVTRAEREQRAIFVYFFLRKDTGPALAPC